MNRKFWKILLVFIPLAILSACSTKSQTRLDHDINLGDLPPDVLYIDGLPQIIAVSTESDGDVVLSYITDDGKVVGQLYGCAYINLNCGKLYKQGRYEWNIPTQPDVQTEDLTEPQ